MSRNPWLVLGARGLALVAFFGLSFVRDGQGAGYSGWELVVVASGSGLGSFGVAFRVFAVACIAMLVFGFVIGLWVRRRGTKNFAPFANEGHLDQWAAIAGFAHLVLLARMIGLLGDELISASLTTGSYVFAAALGATLVLGGLTRRASNKSTNSATR